MSFARLSAIVIVFLSARSEASITILPDPACDSGGMTFAQKVRAYLDDIETDGDCTRPRVIGPSSPCEATSPSFHDMATCLEASDDFKVIIRCDLADEPGTHFFDSAAGAKNISDGFNLKALWKTYSGEPTDAVIDFNPGISEPFPSELCYADPRSTLVHEIAHAWMTTHGTAMNTRWTPVNKSAEYPPDEGGPDGVLSVENAFRLSNGYPCQRGSYLGVPVPNVQQFCLAICCKCIVASSVMMCVPDPNNFCYLYVDFQTLSCPCPNQPPQCNPAVFLEGDRCGFPAC